MLTALTKSGERISLANQYKKETLLFLRKKEKFICPVCDEAVTLKLGDQRIYHFAHLKGSSCSDFYERESDYHMNGKLQLYQWLIQQRIPAFLEYYDVEIQQRPDIMFTYMGYKFALEFQCSPISEELFIKRTRTYYQNGYVPLWIVGNKMLKSKRKNLYSLSCFSYLFLRNTNNNQFYIPSYCPDNMHFHFTGPIISLSTTNAFSQTLVKSVTEIDIKALLQPNLPSAINLALWIKEIDKMNLHYAAYPNPQQKRFLQEIYHNGLNLFLLPSEIGLPIRQSPLISTPTTVWQTYIFLDTFLYKTMGETINLIKVEKNFKERILKKDIIIRNLPQYERTNPFSAVKEYILLLERLGLVSKISETSFKVQQKVTIPKSNREKEEQKNIFFQKYYRLLSKI